MVISGDMGMFECAVEILKFDRIYVIYHDCRQDIRKMVLYLIDSLMMVV